VLLSSSLQRRQGVGFRRVEIGQKRIGFVDNELTQLQHCADGRQRFVRNKLLSCTKVATRHRKWYGRGVRNPAATAGGQKRFKKGYGSRPRGEAATDPGFLEGVTLGTRRELRGSALTK